MKRRLALALAATALVGLTIPSVASAHNISVFPRYGETGDNFLFRGKAWQAFKRVRWYYDQRNDGEFEQTGRFFTNGRGRFLFRWRGEDVFDTHRMCFRQKDTRFSPDRYFFKCKRFTLLPD